jgi:hypothetical protein
MVHVRRQRGRHGIALDNDAQRGLTLLAATGKANAGDTGRSEQRRPG